MQALVFDGALRLEQGRAVPAPAADEALIRLRMAGICNTDLELVKGYMGFSGVLGHEFVGEVVECADPAWKGRRVVGEINCGCGRCPGCLGGDPRHCPERTVLGILGRDGTFAEYLTLPVRNLHDVPAKVPDEVAVFTEPLAAAFEVTEQVAVAPDARVTVLGDGKLGTMVAQVLASTGCDLTVVGKHDRKLSFLRGRGIRCVARSDWRADGSSDVVIEASGSAQGFAAALEAVRPRGTVVLKTTVQGNSTLALAPIVINEIRVVGSRCGPFRPALRALEAGMVSVEPLVDGRYALAEGVAAVAHAGRAGALKVLISP
ncbi:MAG: zinc-binding dehydrogenase [Armatimonadetes bacterium]|nr:zinc-binding dehydrogenase [Armatimonadota bacterium]